MKVGRRLLRWDQFEVLEDRKKWIMEEDGLTEEAADDWLIGYDCSMEWDELIDDLTEIIKRKNQNGCWKAESKNFGWRSLNGEAFFKVEDGRMLLQKVLPKTDCTFNIFNYGKGLAIQNFHHDSPVGKEWYYLYPISELAFEKAQR